MNAKPELENEWLETDGFGAFASGTSSGVRTRRYHNVLMIARNPPSERVILVNGFDVWAETPAGTLPVSSSTNPLIALYGRRGSTGWANHLKSNKNYSFQMESKAQPSDGRSQALRPGFSCTLNLFFRRATIIRRTIRTTTCPWKPVETMED